VYLVSCVSAKKSRPYAARELYCSDWFLKARAYVEAQRAEWFILSAQHHLVKPDHVIAPYNVTLNGMSSADRRTWAVRVIKQLQPLCRPGMEVVFLAGKTYREHLVPVLSGWGCEVGIPMEGLAIGQQKAWLKRELVRLM
jgi:hypothetical protein